MRYFIFLAYNGSAYHGWQIQNNAASVQGELEHALSLILRSKIHVIGAGRTDTGVHASYYVAHFDCDTPVGNTSDLVFHLNSVLPQDISVSRIRQVTDSAHARFDALQREYTYLISPCKTPFCRHLSWFLPTPLALDSMNTAADYLTQFDDFTSFAKLHSGNKTNICHVSSASWTRNDNFIIFKISADRFLRNMVRAITGTLVDVGKGRISPEQFRDIVAARNLSLASSSAPPQGLFLSGISYPENIFVED